MKKKLIFALVVAVFLMPWTTVYAHNRASADTMPIAIQPAPTASQPSLNVYGNAIGSVIPGDLFTIDCSGNQVDTEFNLYITNTDELIKNYRYVNLQIGIYTDSGNGAWQKVTSPFGENVSDIYITMQNSRVNFSLPGNAKYKIMVNKGCFNRYPVIKGQTTSLPEFYLTTAS
jgi:hypothetical protein